jgi:metallo-beta-lactamase family protein
MDHRPVIHFHGAAGTVTGSCHLIQVGDSRVLVDCGLFQGSKTEKELNYRAFPFDPDRIDALILTHAHIDHAGLVPKLVKAGYTGPIFATRGTTDLCAVMLPDSGHIQEYEVEQLNRRNRSRGRNAVTPIYTADDATVAMTQFRAIDMGVWFQPAPGVRARMWNAGHLLGSTSVELELENEGETTRLLMSGDIGPDHKLLQFDPEAPAGFDYVVCESTYGDTDREAVTEARRRGALRAEVKAAINPDGALLIPSFAVERTQELLADLVHLMETGELPVCPIYIDSPLADRATRVFTRHTHELENGDLLARAVRARNVRFTQSVEQSKALDLVKGFHIVIAASGMCEAGRIRHRLKAWLWRDEGTVLLVGFQAAGTLGRILEDGASTVRIQGEEIAVRARIRKLDLYSGHADGPELTAWLRERMPIRCGVFLVHGEEPAFEGLSARISDIAPGDRTIVPKLDSAWRLDRDHAVDVSETRPPPRIDPARPGHRDWHNDFQSLVLDLEAELAKAADDRSRGVVLRRMRRALAGE